MSTVRILDYLHDSQNEYALVSVHGLESRDSIVEFDSFEHAYSFFSAYQYDHWTMGCFRKHVWEQGYYSNVTHMSDIQVCQVMAEAVVHSQLFLINMN